MLDDFPERRQIGVREALHGILAVQARAEPDDQIQATVPDIPGDRHRVLVSGLKHRKFERGSSVFGHSTRKSGMTGNRIPGVRIPSLGMYREDFSGRTKDLSGGECLFRAATATHGHTSEKATSVPAEFGECRLWVAASGSHRRRPGREAEGVENLSSDDWVLDGCQNAHPRAAAGTLQDI